jgi:predicted N-formylglutamate amidohydrolase
VKGRLPVVVSVEHASRAVPAALAGLGLSPGALAAHRWFDPGALVAARSLARALRAPLHAGRYSRLLADLNRSARNPRVIPARVDGRAIPANAALGAEARRKRLLRYWAPYRAAVERDLRAAIARAGCVLHLSVHSFTPVLAGERRGNDVGLLYLPGRARERRLALRWGAALARLGYRVRRNYPYAGDTDGFCTALRATLPARRYLGFEVELNQRAVADSRAARRAGRDLAATLAEELGLLGAG